MSEFNQYPEAFAKKHGLVIIRPEANELQCDIDSKELPSEFAFALDVIGQFNKVVEVNYTTSKSGNLHAYIELQSDVTPHCRIAMQTALGSDPKREILTLRNTFNAANKMPQFLYELADFRRRKNP